MKRVLSMAIVLFTLTMSAQTYVGVKGAAMNTWILNKHIADAGPELDYKGSFAGGFSLAGIHMLGGQSGLTVNLGVSTIKQQVQGDLGGLTIVGQTKMKYTDAGLFYTYLSEGGLFIEVGPQFSFRNDEIEEIYDFKGPDEVTNTFMDDNINSMTVFGVFGIGGLINLNEEFKLSCGLRFGYGLNDLSTELSSEEYIALDSSVKEYSFYSEIAQGADINENSELTLDYKSSNPAFASFNLGLYYCFGK